MAKRRTRASSHSGHILLVRHGLDAAASTRYDKRGAGAQHRVCAEVVASDQHAFEPPGSVKYWGYNSDVKTVQDGDKPKMEIQTISLTNLCRTCG
jgi:hypothetical protein